VPDPADTRDLTLHYLGEVTVGLSKCYDRAHRALVSEVLLSLIVLALCAGLVSAADEVEISGLKFELSSWVLLAGGATLLLPLLASYASQTAQAARLRQEVVALYRKLGFEYAGLDDRARSPFVPPVVGPLTAGLLGRARRPLWMRVLYDWPLTLVLAGAVVLLPLAAQTAAMLKLTSAFGWRLYIWLPLSVLVLVTAISVIGGIARDPSYAESGGAEAGPGAHDRRH
jgi:hypothetical protein